MKILIVVSMLMVNCLLIGLFACYGYASDTMSNPYWHIYITDGGYSDWLISPMGHEQLSGEWGAAILYDGIATGEAMWLERYWACPYWVTNSQFEVVEPFASWDDPSNPIVGYKDTGQGVITNGDVQITIKCSMRDGYTVMGLSPGVALPNRVTSYRYVMLQTYTIRNIGNRDIENLSFFQFIHAHPNDDYGPNNYGVYDPTNYADPTDDFSQFIYDMTFFSPYASWSPYKDDIVGFSSAIRPAAYALGKFQGHGSEPGPGSLHHDVEADSLGGSNYLGPEEIAGAMKWYLGTLRVGEEVSITVLLSSSHSDMGLPPEPVPQPTLTVYIGDTQGYFGERATLSALLTTQNGEPIPNKRMDFQLGTQTAEAITDSLGIAVATLVLSQPPGNYMVTASFLGDNEYGGSLDCRLFEIFEPRYVSVYLDIKPQSCPNPFNMKSNGVLPVAILGTEDFDVMTIDPASVRLEGVAPLRWNYEDVATPTDSVGNLCQCTDAGADGYLDMTLKFNHKAIAETLGDVFDRMVKVLTISGKTYDGRNIEGKDCVVILKKPTWFYLEPRTSDFGLVDVYPNPFNGETEISFALPEIAYVSLAIYDVQGRKVRCLFDEEADAGTYSVCWDGRDDHGNPVASGIYFSKLIAGEFTATKKVILTR